MEPTLIEQPVLKGLVFEDLMWMVAVVQLFEMETSENSKVVI